MEYRRFPVVLPKRKFGCATLLAPQLEDYDVVNSGYCPDLHGPLPPFKVVLNVVSVSPKELTLTFPEDKILQVSVRHGGRKFMSLSFARDCTIRFVIPDDVDKNKLVAKWHSDQYLLICEKDKYSCGSCPSAEATESFTRSGPNMEATESSAGSGTDMDATESSGGSGPGMEATESSGGSGPGAEATESSGGSVPGAEAPESSDGSGPGAEATESSGGSGPGAETTKISGELGPGAEDTEVSGGQGLKNSRKGNDEKSDSVNASPVKPSREDGDPEQGTKDLKILKPVYVDHNLKTSVDLDEIRELFANIGDKATIDENYLLGSFFTSPNVAAQKMKHQDTQRDLRRLLSM